MNKPLGNSNFDSELLTYNLITKDDLEEVREMHNHPKVILFLTDVRPVNQLEQEQWFNKISNSRSNYRFVAREKKTMKLVGVFRLDNLDHVNQSAQVGLDVHPDFQSMGFGTHIYRYFFNLLFHDWNFHRLYLETLSNNNRARNLYEKLGMNFEGTLREAIFRNGKYIDVVVYSILRSEWNNL